MMQNLITLYVALKGSMYIAFHGFGQVKFFDGGSVLGSNQFSILPQLPQKIMSSLKGVKIDSKISNSRC